MLCLVTEVAEEEDEDEEEVWLFWCVCVTHGIWLSSRKGILFGQMFTCMHHHCSYIHLGHDDVLALLDELVLGFDDGLQELEVVDVSAVGLDAVHKVLHHPLVDLAAQLEVVHEDVLHGHGLQNLRDRKGGG